MLVCKDATVIGSTSTSDSTILYVSCCVMMLSFQSNMRSSFLAHAVECGSHFDGVSRNTSSQVFRVSTLGHEDLKYKNTLHNDNGILKSSTGKHDEWLFTEGYPCVF